VVLAKLRGDDAAKLTQLAMEYDPEPPFNLGKPQGRRTRGSFNKLEHDGDLHEQLASNPGTVSRVE